MRSGGPIDTSGCRSTASRSSVLPRTEELPICGLRRCGRRERTRCGKVLTGDAPMNIPHFPLYLGATDLALAGDTRGHFLVALVLGFIGALLGSWIDRVPGVPELLRLQLGSERFDAIWSILGAALPVAILGRLTRPHSGLPSNSSL